MKKLFLVCLIGGILFIPSFYSCNKSDSSTDTLQIYTVPVNVAARYITIAFANASGGVNMHIEKAAYYALGTASFDTTFNISVTDTSKTIRYSHALDYNAAFLNNPRKFSFNYYSDGGFYSLAMASNGEQHGQYYFTSLDTITNPLILNGTGTDGGTQTSSTSKVSFSSNFNFTLKNVRVDKKTLLIKDGTATIHIGGLGPGMVSFSYSGTITFNGNRKATLVLNNLTYYMNLDTGVMGK